MSDLKIWFNKTTVYALQDNTIFVIFSVLFLFCMTIQFVLLYFQFINLGVKCFSNAPSPLVPDCDYRLSQDVRTSKIIFSYI